MKSNLFLLAKSERLSIGSVKGRVGELRSLLRFLYLQGLTPRPMGAVVPSCRRAAGCRLARHRRAEGYCRR